MKQLAEILEGLLDDEFDITDNDVLTLKQLGYRLVTIQAQLIMEWSFSKDLIKRNFGINASRVGGDDPFNDGWETYIGGSAIKWFKNKWGWNPDHRTIAWAMRIMLDNCHTDINDIMSTLEKLVGNKNFTVKISGNKILIKTKDINNKLSFTFAK